MAQKRAASNPAVSSPEPDPQPNQSPRQRDAARTKRALLVAAQELFGAHGFAGTTIRGIGERAGVDPALIARYFGNKTALYIASLEAEPLPDEPDRRFDAARVERLMKRSARVGTSPVLRAALVPADDADIRRAVRRILVDRLVDPIVRQLEAKGSDHPRLRAEIVTAALAGILLGRTADTFEALSSADHEDVVSTVVEMIERMLASET